MKLNRKLDRIIVYMNKVVKNQCSLDRVLNDMNNETK